jgi:hypothetical protein
MNILPVLERLAYRYPSVLVDAVIAHDPGRRNLSVFPQRQHCHQ